LNFAAVGNASFAAVGNASNNQAKQQAASPLLVTHLINQAKQQAAVASFDQRPKLSSAEIVIETADSFIILIIAGNHYQH
jgi:hypothetical protein